MNAAAPSVIAEEVARFDALGDSWWDEDGPMAPLHRLTPVRVAWARDVAAAPFRARGGGRACRSLGLTILDVGCGAGLFAEPLARLGGDVLGIDPAPASIGVARRHAEETGARLAYRVATVEELAGETARFDVVDRDGGRRACRRSRALRRRGRLALKPGGLFLASTLNRTLKSFALAIVGAEYVLRWLEPGTHRWEQFVTPEELALAARQAGLKVIERKGVSYDPLRRTWRLSSDLGVNYQLAAKKPRADGRRDASRSATSSTSPIARRASRTPALHSPLPRAFLGQAVHRLGEAGQRKACRWSPPPFIAAAFTTSVSPFFISAISALSRAAFFTQRLAPLGRRSNDSSPTVAIGAIAAAALLFGFGLRLRLCGLRIGLFGLGVGLVALAPPPGRPRPRSP